MKAYFKLLIVPLLIATACSPSYVGTSAFQDDIYYVPGGETLIDQEMAVYTTKVVKKEPTIEQTRIVEPTTKTTFKDDTEFQLIQEQYREMLANDSIGTIDTTYYNEEQGYFIGEFNGTDSDLDEIERLRQWYPQGFGYYDNSGYNTAMWLAGDPDWNVYVDGDNVWWTPTWTNYNYYNSFRFSSVQYGRHFAYNNPYYGSSFGFGIGFGMGYGYYDPFYYGGGYGMGYPYYGYPYYGHHHHHHGGHHGYYNQPKNHYGSRSSTGSKVGTRPSYTNRSAVSKTNRTANRVNRSAGYSTKSGTTTNRSATTAKEAVRRSSKTQRYGTRNSRSSYSNRLGTTSKRTNTSGTVKRSNYKGTTTRYGTQNRSTYQRTKSGTTTNRRRTSNYTKPQSNSRPSYNKSGTKRSSNTRAINNRTSRYSKVKSTPSYKRSSTKSSSSSYRPSRSSSSSRSSGAVRSSGSTSRSSNTGTRSSGSTTRRR